MKKKFMTMSKHLLLLLSIIFSVVAMIRCLTTQFTNAYEYLWLLPCSYLVLSLLFYRIMSKGNLLTDIPTIAFVLLIFVRNGLTPYFMAMFGTRSSLGSLSDDSIRFAIWLITYETLVIYGYVIYKKTSHVRFSIGKKLVFKRSSNKNSYSRRGNNQLFVLACSGATLISIATLMLVPAIRSQYYSIFTSDITHLIQAEANYASGTFLRVLSTGGEILIETMRVILPAIAIFQIRKKKESVARLLFSFVIVFSQMLWMNDSNAYILMVMITEVIYIYKLYPKYSGRIFQFGLIVGGLFLGLLMINRFALDHYAGSPSLWLQSYFPSVSNAAGIKVMAKEHDFLQFFSDLFVAIPFKTFFGYSGNVLSTAKLWNAANGIKGQIVPNIAIGYYYFGFILSPILSVISINVSYRLFARMKELNNPIQFAAYTYFMLYSMIMPFTYNWNIYIQCFTNRAIFVFIIASLSQNTFSELNGHSVNEGVN